MGHILIFLCVLMWGISAFLNRLSIEKISPILLQCISGIIHMLFIPIALKMSGVVNPITYNWSIYSIILTTLATICSISANVMLYMTIKGNNNSGATLMLVSLYPVVTLLLSVVFLNQHISTIKLLGVILMIIGAIFLSIK